MARALTKHKDGSRYARPPVVEINIDDALISDPPFLRRRLLVTDKGAPGYLRSECLVYLIREAHRAGDDRCHDTLLRILLGRCEAILKAKVSEQLPRSEICSRF